jgi:hypothetical protein
MTIKALFFDRYVALCDLPSGALDTRVREPIFLSARVRKRSGCSDRAVRAAERGKQSGEWKSCDPETAKFI